jgi:hypothetical protein
MAGESFVFPSSLAVLRASVPPWFILSFMK